MAQTFTNSQLFLQYMQSRYGSANFNQWQSLRKQFYSFVNYPQAGANQFNFFGYAVSGSAGQSRQFTNMPKAGSFGQQHFLLKSIKMTYYVSTLQNYLTSSSGIDTQNVAADFLHGFAQAGELEVTIGGKTYAQIPKPFLYCPPADGETTAVDAKGFSLTLTEATPNTLNTAVNLVSHADLNRNAQNAYIVDPNILIEAEQSFEVVLNYPSGLIPLIATGKLTSNFYVGVVLDGIVFRPQQ